MEDEPTASRLLEVSRVRPTLSMAIAMILRDMAIVALSPSHTSLRVVPAEKAHSVFSRRSIKPIKVEEIAPQTRDALKNVFEKKKQRRAKRSRPKASGKRRRTDAAGGAPSEPSVAQEERDEQPEEQPEQEEGGEDDEEDQQQQQQKPQQGEPHDCSISRDAQGDSSSCVRMVDRIEAPVALSLHRMGLDPTSTAFTSEQVLSLMRSSAFVAQVERALDE
jgi:hypothetical protein